MSVSHGPRDWASRAHQCLHSRHGWGTRSAPPGCRLPLIHDARRVRDRAHHQPRLRLSQREIRSNCRQRIRPIPNNGPDRCIALLPLRISSRMLDPGRRRAWRHSISNGARVLRRAGCAIHVGLDFGELNPPDWAALGHDHDLEDQPVFGVPTFEA